MLLLNYSVTNVAHCTGQYSISVTHRMIPNRGAGSGVAGVAAATPVSKVVWQVYGFATPVLGGTEKIVAREKICAGEEG